MSQIRFNAIHDVDNKVTNVQIMAGWDQPLHGFFMTIFKQDKNKDGDEDTFYSGLDDPQTMMGQMPTTDYFRMLLSAFGIKAPDGFWERVELREGNVMYDYADEP